MQTIEEYANPRHASTEGITRHLRERAEVFSIHISRNKQGMPGIDDAAQFLLDTLVIDSKTKEKRR